MEITAEQFEEWKEHPVTKEIFKGLRDLKEDIAEQMLAGNTLGGTAEETHAFTAKAIGQAQGIDQLLNIRFD